MVAPRRVALVAALFVSLASCSPGTATSTTSTTVATTSTAQATTSTAVASTTSTLEITTTTPPAEQTVVVLLQPFSELGPSWDEIFLPYGDGEGELGTAPGGDGLMLGPEYGTQTSDGSWWILDAAKMRVAIYDPAAEFSGAIPFPEEVLVDGQYFQYQMPQALDDGTIVATGFRGEQSSELLRIVDNAITSTTFDGATPWVTTDGAYLYGLGFEDSQPYRLDVANPSAELVESLVTRAMTPFMIEVQGDQVTVRLPDQGLTRTLQLRFSEDPAVPVFGGIEVETGEDGSIFILIYGAPESEETLGVGGYLSISPQGVVSEAEPIREPFSPADPGSPAHLGVTPGTSNPWLMMIDEDGARIYTRGT